MHLIYTVFLYSQELSFRLIAQASGSGGSALDPVSFFAPLGIASIVCVVLWMQAAKSEKKAEQERLDRLAAEARERDTNNKLFNLASTVFPLLARTGETLSDANVLLGQQVRKKSETAADVIEQLQQVLSEVRNRETGSR